MTASDDVMRVGLTVEQLWQRVPGGSGSYILELLRALAEQPDLETVGLSAHHRDPLVTDLRPSGRIRSFGLPRYPLYRAWNHLSVPRPEWVDRRLDVVHATTWAIPPTRRPLVVTVHDVAFLRDPSHFTPRGVRFFTRALDRTRDEAAIVIVPSQATADDCVTAGIDAARLRVIPHGAPAWIVSTDDMRLLRERLDLPERFVLWCGTNEPRKNLGGLLRAFALVAEQDPDLHLVLVGPRGWGEQESAAAGPASSRVHEVGRLPARELSAAYALATAFAFPSFWEGFGLPALEAMSVGVPVVTSRNTSMAEVVGESGVLVDPWDAEDLAAGIVRVVGPDGPAIGRSGLVRASAFTWRLSAQAHVEAYRAALGHATAP